MPIDTASKRKSAAGVPFWALGPGVTPDAAKPVAWRQQAGWGYSGIAAGEAPEPDPAPNRVVFTGTVCRRKEF